MRRELVSYAVSHNLFSHVNSPAELIARPDAVAINLRGTTGDEVVRALHAKLGTAEGAVLDSPQLLAEIVERAKLSSVCIAPDVAMPHARTEAVQRIVLAVGRTAEPVAFDEEHPKVRLVFLIGTPREQVTEYLKTVATISRLLKDPTTRAALLVAPTEAEFRAQLGRAVKR